MRQLTAPIGCISRALAGRRRDERGNLVIVMTIVMVLVLLSSLLMVRIIGNNEIIRARQNTFSGVTGANAGLSDVLFRLDQGVADVGTTGWICYNPTLAAKGDTNCNVTVNTTSSPQLNGVEYVAHTVPIGTPPASATEWIVQAIGQAQTGFHGAVQETLTRESKFKFAIFANKQLTVTGNSSNNFDFGNYSPGSPVQQCSNTSTVPCVYIGSNGPVSCSGPSPASVYGIYYNNGSGGGSDSCGTPDSQNTVYKVPVPTTPKRSQPCPNGGNLGSTYGYPTIPPGTYLCTTAITIGGTLDVGTCSPVGSCDPNVYFYVMTGSSSANFMTVNADSQINADYSQPPPALYNAFSAGNGPPSDMTTPNSQLFQLYTDSSGNLTTNGNHGFVWGGVIYAPNAYLTTNGCKSYFMGAVVINTYTCHGGPNLAFYYDSNLSTDYGDWQVSGYQQINPSAVNFP
jgi:hypothetical protein